MLKYDNLLSSFAFNFSLRRYSKEIKKRTDAMVDAYYNLGFGDLQGGSCSAAHLPLTPLPEHPFNSCAWMLCKRFGHDWCDTRHTRHIHAGCITQRRKNLSL
jgi:hypothetical protein